MNEIAQVVKDLKDTQESPTCTENRRGLIEPEAWSRRLP